MYTKTGLLISISIVLMVSIAMGFCGVDSSMKTQLQNAVGKDGEPCYDVSTEQCGGESDECHHCTDDPTSPPSCNLEGDLLVEDQYHVCRGTSEDKYCRFNHTLSCGNKYFCTGPYAQWKHECDKEDGEIDGDCVETGNENSYCRQCERGELWPEGQIVAHDEKCQ